MAVAAKDDRAYLDGGRTKTMKMHTLKGYSCKIQQLQNNGPADDATADTTYYLHAAEAHLTLEADAY